MIDGKSEVVAALLPQYLSCTDWGFTGSSAVSGEFLLYHGMNKANSQLKRGHFPPHIWRLRWAVVIDEELNRMFLCPPLIYSNYKSLHFPPILRMRMIVPIFGHDYFAFVLRLQINIFRDSNEEILLIVMFHLFMVNSSRTYNFCSEITEKS